MTSDGYCLKYILDVLGQNVQLLDNGDSSPDSEPSRIMFTRTYDSLSRVTSKTDAAGLVTVYNAYDAFNRILSLTDPDGNVITNSFDDFNLRTTSSVNGSLRVMTQLDGFNRKISVSKYADCTDASVDYFLKESYEYNGFGTLFKLAHDQVALDQSTTFCLDTIVHTFDAEDNIQLETVSSKSDVADAAYDTLQRTYIRDIFGLTYTYSKTITYSDGRSFTHDGPVDIYNNCKLLVQHRNQIDQEETYTYDDNGWKTSMTRFDSGLVSYTFDDLGRPVTVKDSEELESRTYLSNGRLASMSVASPASAPATSVEYSYSLDGSITAVTYPNNQVNTYGLDNLGRIVTQTDVYGVQRSIVFDSKGHVESRTMGNNNVTYTYGIANHTAGQLLQDATIGSKEQIRTLQYDGYGRVRQVVVTDPQAPAVWLSSQYQHSAQGKLQSITMSSTLSDSKQLNCTKVYSYDGLGQLVSGITTYTDGTTDTVNFVYDGNCNIVSKTQNGITESRAFNIIGQRIDSGFTYDANGRMLTDNNNRTYTYSADDRLQSVNGVAFTYHPDGSLASSANSAGQISFYYDNGAVNVADTPSGVISYQLEPDRRLAAYNQTSADLTYFVENNGSKVLTVAPSATSVKAYGVYGESTDSASSDDLFGYRQEYTEYSSGLVYLRSRFYQPDLDSFITMDAIRKENRYAYCGGDPINQSDPTGHSEGGAMAAGLAAGAVVSLLAGLVTGGIAIGAFGMTATAAMVSATTIAGAAGNMTGYAVGQSAAHEKINGLSLGIDALAGAVGGAVGAGCGGAAGTEAMELTEPLGFESQNVNRIGAAVSSSVGAATGSLSSGVTQNILNGRPVTSGSNALSFVTGLFAGLGGGMLTSMSYLAIGGAGYLALAATSSHFDYVEMDTFVEENADDGPKRYQSFVPHKEFEEDMAVFRNGRFCRSDMFRLKSGAAEPKFDTYAVHAFFRDVFPTMRRTANGEEEIVMRPMKGTTFAQFLLRKQEAGEFGRDGPVKALTCYGALFNAKAVAKALQRRVFASYKKVGVDDFDITWRERTP